MKVTKIETQVKHKGRYSIFIDDVFAFGLSELGLINSELRVGQQVSGDEIKKFKDDAQTDRIYNLTLSLISRRPRSQWEVEDYLRRKETEPHTSQEIIARLQERNYINDLDFARRWVESRRLRGPISERKLELELRAKRIADNIVKDTLKKDDTSEFDVLVTEVEKKRRQPRYQDDTKLMQYLARQGYRYDDIKRALEES